nr:glyoxalase superfamily protein [Nakamurella flavida]
MASRILLRPADRARSQAFYRDVLGLAVSREFGPPDAPGLVFHAGTGFIEVSGSGEPGRAGGSTIWLQVRDVRAEHERLAAAGVQVLRAPVQEPWGLIEMWIADPDGNRLVIVEIPPDHPIRRDVRPPTGLGG